MRSIKRMLAAAALLAATSPTAHALDLFTTAAETSNGHVFSCVIVNVGTQPIQVSAKLQSYWDGSDITVATSCQGTLAPGTGCNASGSNNAVVDGYCHFTSSSSKVRAALLVYNSSYEVTSTLPATK